VVPEDAPSYQLPYHYARHAYTLAARQVLRGLYYDVHAVAGQEAEVQELHNNAEVFDVHAEKIYQYLQVSHSRGAEAAAGLQHP